MANKQSAWSKISQGMTPAQFAADIVSFFRELVVQGSVVVGIFTIMLIDIILGGVSMFFMFEGTPLISPMILASLFSIALSTVSYSLWRMIGKGSVYDKWMMLIIAIMIPLDLWIDLAFMEIVKGTGDVWLFLSPAALAAVPRPPLWWGFMLLIGLITLVNEPLTAVLTKAMKQNADFNARFGARQPKKQPKKNYRRPQPHKQRKATPSNQRPVAPVAPITKGHYHQRADVPLSDQELERMFQGG